MYYDDVTTANFITRDLDRAVALFHALSDPTRLAVLELLRGGELCVCDLQTELAAAQSRLSFHLRVLREAGLVTDRREGRWSYYSVVPETLDEVRDLAIGLRPGGNLLPVHRSVTCCV